MNKKRYISYSLWGQSPIYTTGMLYNIDQAKTTYKGWDVVVYHDASIPAEILTKIKNKGAKTILIDTGLYGMFWRFFAADLPDCEYVIFRDSDSRLSKREKKAVDVWIQSGKDLHIMYDHPFHQGAMDGQAFQIFGGMWGVKGNLVNITEMINRYSSDKSKSLIYGSDQVFLNEVYQIFKDSHLVHDEFFSNNPYPVKRLGYRFIGERFDENNKPLGDDWKAIRDHYRATSISGKIRSLLRKVYHLLQTGAKV